MGLFDSSDLTLERAMQGASLRQQVLSNNLANVNTPGFKRSDVDFESQLAEAAGSGDASQLQSVAFQPKVDNASTMRADGNNVDVDQEMANMTENAVHYQAIEAIEKTRMQMLLTAMGR